MGAGAAGREQEAGAAMRVRGRLRVALALLFLGLVIAPETGGEPVEIRGYASAYAEGVMEDVIAWRNATGTWRHPPRFDWYQSHGAVATNDCAEVGLMATLVAPGGREYRVLVADCGGDEPGAGAHWMRENNIVAELDWRLWERLTAAHGRPLEVGLR